MVSEIVQLISDEIICHKKAIEDLDEKLKLLIFLNSVDVYMGRAFNLDKNELMSKRGDLENKLKNLIEKKVALTGSQKQPDELHPNGNIQSAFLMSNYLSLHNFTNIDADLNQGSNS
ncbi:MAG: hypothetical protein A2Y25_03765 [Candidatus Melainabacteria bacterium GWF2_37_15]|nr:MAG: hypothetical protein A2Y25_03765 [Candidatus Melainabacteria bacterium GWF2_37_15]